MKEVVFNDNGLTSDDIEMEVIRVKGLIFNSYGKILLVHNNDTYQFPGGHKEDDESMDSCILREIKDETGISLTIDEKPFLCIHTYDNDYFGTGKKVLNSIYYYRFFTDQLPDFTQTHYDELELASDFNLFYLDFKQLDSFLKEQRDSQKMDENIAKEMLCVIEEYHKLFST